MVRREVHEKRKRVAVNCLMYHVSLLSNLCSCTYSIEILKFLSWFPSLNFRGLANLSPFLTPSSHPLASTEPPERCPNSMIRGVNLRLIAIMGSCLSTQARHSAIETSNQAWVPASSAAASNTNALTSQKLSFSMDYGNLWFGRIFDANCNGESDVIARLKEVNAPSKNWMGFRGMARNSVLE